VAESAPVVLSRLAAGREAVAYCFTPHNLRRTVRIALLVGVLLTTINQGAVITAGHATAATWARSALNFVVPFLVSNAGLLGGRHPESRSGGPGPSTSRSPTRPSSGDPEVNPSGSGLDQTNRHGQDAQ